MPSRVCVSVHSTLYPPSMNSVPEPMSCTTDEKQTETLGFTVFKVVRVNLAYDEKLSQKEKLRLFEVDLHDAEAFIMDVMSYCYDLEHYGRLNTKPPSYLLAYAKMTAPDYSDYSNNARLIVEALFESLANRMKVAGCERLDTVVTIRSFLLHIYGICVPLLEELQMGPGSPAKRVRVDVAPMPIGDVPDVIKAADAIKQMSSTPPLPMEVAERRCAMTMATMSLKKRKRIDK